MRPLLYSSIVAAAGALAAASGGIAGQPVTQTLNPPPPSYYTCMAVGQGTICEGTPRVESFGPIDTALEGDPLPSVRTVASEFRVNPLTVLKAYQQLVDEDLVEMKRGLGMFVKPGARDQLLKDERQKFLTDEWPRIAEKIERLGLTQRELDAAARRPARSGKDKR